jgi:hypothetical protein
MAKPGKTGRGKAKPGKTTRVGRGRTKKRAARKASTRRPLSAATLARLRRELLGVVPRGRDPEPPTY